MASRQDGDPHAPYDAALQLSPEVDAAGIARRFVYEHRTRLDPEVVADAQLLVSEIVTNAVRHGTGEITLHLRLDPPGVGVSVSDSSDRLPIVADGPLPDTQGSGRGLLIVDAVATRWGVERHAAVPGKTVWFDLYPAGVGPAAAEVGEQMLPDKRGPTAGYGDDATTRRQG